MIFGDKSEQDRKICRLNNFEDSSELYKTSFDFLKPRQDLIAVSAAGHSCAKCELLGLYMNMIFSDKIIYFTMYLFYQVFRCSSEEESLLQMELKQLI